MTSLRLLCHNALHSLATSLTNLQLPCNLKRWFEPDAGRLVCKSDGDVIDVDALDGDALVGDDPDGDALDRDAPDGDVIDVDALDGDPIDGDACNGGNWKRIGDVSLTEIDKEELLTGKWLNDKVIHASQLLMKQGEVSSLEFCTS